MNSFRKGTGLLVKSTKNYSINDGRRGVSLIKAGDAAEHKAVTAPETTTCL